MNEAGTITIDSINKKGDLRRVKTKNIEEVKESYGLEFPCEFVTIKASMKTEKDFELLEQTISILKQSIIKS